MKVTNKVFSVGTKDLSDKVEPGIQLFSIERLDDHGASELNKGHQKTSKLKLTVSVVLEQSSVTTGSCQLCQRIMLLLIELKERMGAQLGIERTPTSHFVTLNCEAVIR